jgi:sec-independent protein translocase protein TatB
VFGFSFSELFVISLVTLVAVGPQKLPGMLKTMGQWMRKLRKMTMDVRQQTGIDEMLRAEGIQLSELRSLMRGQHSVAPTPAPARPYEDPYANVEPDPTREYPPEGADAYGALPDDLFEDAGSAPAQLAGAGTSEAQPEPADRSSPGSSALPTALPSAAMNPAPPTASPTAVNAAPAPAAATALKPAPAPTMGTALNPAPAPTALNPAPTMAGASAAAAAPHLPLAGATAPLRTPLVAPRPSGAAPPSSPRPSAPPPSRAAPSSRSSAAASPTRPAGTPPPPPRRSAAPPPIPPSLPATASDPAPAPDAAKVPTPPTPQSNG